MTSVGIGELAVKRRIGRVLFKRHKWMRSETVQVVKKYVGLLVALQEEGLDSARWEHWYERGWCSKKNYFVKFKPDFGIRFLVKLWHSVTGVVFEDGLFIFSLKMSCSLGMHCFHWSKVWCCYTHFKIFYEAYSCETEKQLLLAFLAW